VSSGIHIAPIDIQLWRSPVMSISAPNIDVQLRTLPWQEEHVQQQVNYDRRASVDQRHFQFGRKASLVLEDIKVNEEYQRVKVRLPNLFNSSFGIVRDIAVNPEYENLRQDSEAWLAQ